MTGSAAVTEDLLFEGIASPFTIPATAIASIRIGRPPMPVPLAPPGICGLTIEDGRLITVLDGDQLFGHDTTTRDLVDYLIFLEAPYSHLALQVTARSRPANGDDAPPLELERLLSQLEIEILERASPTDGA